MRKNYDYIIVGAGLCGLVLAKELSRNNKKILLLEKGPFINKLGTVLKIVWFYDKLGFFKSNYGITIYRVFGVGGSSLVSAGNAVEFSEEEYNKIGIDFKEELAEARIESCVKENLPIGKASAKIMEVANKLGYDMHPMPKFSVGKCVSCGNCVLGCKYGAKWTSRECLKGINQDNIDLLTGFPVKKIIISQGKALGIEGRGKFFADKIISSAGGIGTPVILQNSGVEAGDNLFLDLYNVTYGISEEFNQAKELTMAVVCTKFHKDEGFVLAPFVDNWGSLYPNVRLQHVLNVLRIHKLMGIMTKITDDSVGKVHKDGRVYKVPTENDLKKLKRGSDIAKEILIGCGVNPKSIFVTTLASAHPGGTAAIGRVVDKNLETKVKNLYVCDASVLPFAPGLPPMLSLIALTKWFGKKVLGAG